ncbi:helix-turn-helix domain-containing protein [Mycobacteroides abscessus]|uniref:helix-turn-helix domain-containing protein n=1 Tax=Mycobacteroides abscessus TaxID=36809 RepID=UPI0010421358|nr:helix-turn-helix domain-containing protein [Mycobacteroides abscessus]MBN7296641.1 helix-turn-helix domain-containing protein [Mycobacteroides abscessus subsp. abscessus]
MPPIQAAARDIVQQYRRALFPLLDLKRTEYLNGVKVAANVGGVMRELGTVAAPERKEPTVDVLERALVLEIVAAGIPPSVVARRCRIAPATVARWVAEVNG